MEALLREKEERLDASVLEIHRHPLRPPGFAEPLFLGRGAKKEIAEHFRKSSGWLGRADDVPVSEPAEEPCHVIGRPDGNAYLVRARRGRPACRRRRPGFAKQRVARVIERWREVRGWWEPGGGTDRLLFRVLLSGGSIVDLAVDRSGEGAGAWSLVRVLD
jgi:hypothetical protein